MDEAKRILKAGRSPYGERGLKYAFRGMAYAVVDVTLLTESVD